MCASLIGCQNSKSDNQLTNEAKANKKEIEELKQKVNEINSQCSNLKLANTQLELENDTLKTDADEFHSPKTIGVEIPENWKMYRYLELGYEIAYPQDYNLGISGGHSPAANPELGMRLSLSSKDNQVSLDIDLIDKVGYEDKYTNAEEYVKFKNMNLIIDEDNSVNIDNNKIYKLEGETYYLFFVENENYIFRLSSSSKETLKKVIKTFRFI